MAWVEKSGPGRWRVRFREDGTVQSVPGFRSRREALDCVTKVETGWRPRPGVTLGAWARDWWSRLDADKRTAENYRAMYRQHIQPRWAEEVLTGISPSVVETWARELHAEGYASTVVRAIRAVLSAMLADAVDQGVIEVNPVRWRGCRAVEVWRVPTWASPGEVLEVAANAGVVSTVGDGLMIVMAAWTGTRWGELAGLQRTNVHLGEGCVRVDAVMGVLYESAHRVWLGSPARAAAARWIALPPFLVDLLRRYLASHDLPMVFPNAAGTWRRRSHFSQHVMRAAADGVDGSVGLRTGGCGCVR